MMQTNVTAFIDNLVVNNANVLFSPGPFITQNNGTRSRQYYGAEATQQEVISASTEGRDLFETIPAGELDGSEGGLAPDSPLRTQLDKCMFKST